MTIVRMLTCLVVSAVMFFVSSSSMDAQTVNPPPTAFLERARIVGVEKNIYVTRVPTQDVTGAVKYLDLEITLNVNNEGMVDAATVVSAESPQLLTNAFVAGNYEEVNGSQCVLATGVALEGRTALAFNCTGNTTDTINVTWYTGPIAGHPFELDLTGAGIDQIPGHENLSWGKITFIASISSAFDCFLANHIIGANQVGNILTITNYVSDNIVDCGHQFHADWTLNQLLLIKDTSVGRGYAPARLSRLERYIICRIRPARFRDVFNVNVWLRYYLGLCPYFPLVI